MRTPNESLTVSSPNITTREIELVNQALRANYPDALSMVKRFETAVADFVGSEHAIAVSSGTAGLHLAALVAGLGPGDAVITSPFSSIASANCILYVGALPVFVDIDPHTLTLDSALVAQAADDLIAGGDTATYWLPPTVRHSQSNLCDLKALLPVHIFGQSCAMDSLIPTAQKHNLIIIEDAREALGAQFQGRSVGTFGACGVFSFSADRQIATGEGGMLVTKTDEWAVLFRSLRNQEQDELTILDETGRSSAIPGNWRDHVRLGYDYQLSELSAALGIAQMERIEELLVRREQVANWYTERLVELDGVQVPVLAPGLTRASWSAYVVRLAPELDRDRIRAALAERGIHTRSHTNPLHLQPFYRERFGFREGDFPVTEQLARSILALPFSGQVVLEQVEEVYQTLRELLLAY